MRASVCCHRFVNLRETFQGDASRNLTVSTSMTSQEFKPMPCNCNYNCNCSCSRERPGLCDYDIMRRNSIGVYQVKCNNAGKVSMRCAPQKLKARMQQCFCEVKTCMQSTLQPNPSPDVQRETITCSVIWQSRQPDQSGQNICYQNLCPVHQRKNSNSKTI